MIYQFIKFIKKADDTTEVSDNFLHVARISCDFLTFNLFRASRGKMMWGDRRLGSSSSSSSQVWMSTSVEHWQRLSARPWNARLERPYSMKVPFKCTKHPWCPCINILVVWGPLEKHLRARKARLFLRKPDMTSLLWETQTRSLRKTANKAASLALYVFQLFLLDLLGFWR